MSSVYEWEAEREQDRRLQSEKDLPEDFFRKLITVETAAALVGVKPSTIHNWISRGYVDQYGQRSWVNGFHIDGVRRVMPVDVLRADAAVERAARGGLRKRAM